jgi:hypothetical protein
LDDELLGPLAPRWHGDASAAGFVLKLSRREGSNYGMPALKIRQLR